MYWLTAALVGIVLTLWLKKRAATITTQPVMEAALHEGEWLPRWAELNALKPKGPDFRIGERDASYAIIEGMVTYEWRAYAASTLAQNRKPFYRSIKVVLRDWHSEGLAGD